MKKDLNELIKKAMTCLTNCHTQLNKITVILEEIAALENDQQLKALSDAFVKISPPNEEDPVSYLDEFNAVFAKLVEYLESDVFTSENSSQQLEMLSEEMAMCQEQLQDLSEITNI